MNLLKWILFPGVHVVCRIGGDEGGGGDSAGAKYEEEEARKSELRKQIDLMYGVDVPGYAKGPAPDRASFTKKAPRFVGETNTNPTKNKNLDGFFADVALANAAERGAEILPPGTDEFDQAGYDKAVSEYNAAGDGTAARAAMEAENTKLGDATRSYYTDKLGKDYTKAERETRFKLARQGLMGGSEDIYQQDEIESDRDLGATRVDEAVRRAVSDLKGKREAERLNAVQLVNAGAGDSAVSAAQTGLKNTFEAANSAQRVNLFDDLFANTADAVANNGQQEQQSALLARYRNQLGSFVQGRSTSSGRITPSA